MAADDSFVDRLEKTYQAIAQIELLTKAEDPAQYQLNQSIATALRYLREDELREAEFAACLAETSELGRSIIRGEGSA